MVINMVCNFENCGKMCSAVEQESFDYIKSIFCDDVQELISKIANDNGLSCYTVAMDGINFGLTLYYDWYKFQEDLTIVEYTVKDMLWNDWDVDFNIVWFDGMDLLFDLGDE